MSELTWVEISESSLTNNIRQLRNIIGTKTLLCPCVKANAYGHGLIPASKTFVAAGADWLAVNSIYEAKALRNAGITVPVYILGYVPLNSIETAVGMDCRLVVYNMETLRAVSAAAKKHSTFAKVHIKVETGTNRQGIPAADLNEFAAAAKSMGNIFLEGLSTHFANIEDTTDHSYAEHQLSRFHQAAASLKSSGFEIPLLHCANSAATILFKKTLFHMVRPGIACYGMWPSDQTRQAYAHEIKNGFKLSPALTWKTKMAQIKHIPAGESIGYGCTVKTERPTTLAIVPVGYYDGYDRSIRQGHVLVKGRRAPILGRICMNIIMADITDIPGVNLEDEVILIGTDGRETASAEDLAAWAGTINYEITTRINDRIPRVLTD